MKTDLHTSSATADRVALLETFVRIVEAGTLSAAAAQLGSTQPTISRRLQALERSLGVRLLQRSTHAMTLTDDGARCYERAKELIAGWQSFESEVRGASDEPAGLLRVMVPHALGQHQLVGPLVDYLKRYPRMAVEWRLEDRTPDFTAEGIDCAIQVGEVSDPSVVALRLAEVPRIVVAAPSLLDGAPLPTEPAELQRLPWLAMHTFYRTEIRLTHAVTGEMVRVPIRPRLSTDGLYALRNAAVLGVGVAVASAWAMNEELEAGRLLHLAPQWRAPPLPVHIVYPPARFYPARLRRFIDIMRNALPQAVAALPSRPEQDQRDQTPNG
ncbi:LysR family transcriptional regulator [Azospirillum sp. TSO35-2]|uniref:LysR family transcriptional regulator n=1 Tax=Azospirillum sp. TSO35-2 TaxID=716796 RepID=UPI000D621613|nr:LysR family transcriptional regulator [Azospirillum sp. TSO35-2]PWC31279.1 LysR family transcriptional regulator [Azospirillum sp. TSO35-2]